jgi:hypothetical protein
MNLLGMLMILVMAMAPPNTRHLDEMAILTLILNLPLIWFLLYIIWNVVKTIYKTVKWHVIAISGLFGMTYTTEGVLFGTTIRRTYRGHKLLDTEYVRETPKPTGS